MVDNKTKKRCRYATVFTDIIWKKDKKVAITIY